ncbi:MAG: hypothetical protein RL268_1313 [Pseudomonadota bacterium]
MKPVATQWWTSDQAIFSTCEAWELFSLMSENGYDSSRLMRRSKEIYDQLLNPSGRLSLNQCREIMGAAMSENAGRLPRELGRRLHLTAFGPPGFAILTSSNLADAINMIAHFAMLLNIKFPIEVRADGRIRLHCTALAKAEEKTTAALFQLDLAKLQNFIEDLTNPCVSARSVRIGAHDTAIDECSTIVEDVWREDHLSTVVAEIQVPAALMSRPLSRAHAELHRHCVAEGHAMLDELRSTLDVRSAIISRFRNLDVGVPSMSEIAADLDMSERTLRRKLMRLGTSFSELRDEVRNSLASELFASGNLTTEDVAERLGYSDAANFRQAFKRWQGEAPSHFRKKMSKADSGVGA